MKGICFKEPLFHATVEGRKTQTRRLMEPQPHGLKNALSEILYNKPIVESGGKPRYKVGDVVYLKEPYFDCQNCEGLYYDLYKYAGHELPYTTSKWKNKLFMPESVARYFIKIIAVRAERLQEISDKDCTKEGVDIALAQMLGTASYHDGIGCNCYNSVKTYAALIDKINGKGTWESNPWVWVYDYELCESVKPKE